VPWCGGCNTTKNDDEFYAGQRWCKPCLKAASGAALRRRRERAKSFVLNHLLRHPCVDCGETDPVVLEFDHTGEKTSEISRLAHEGVRIEVLQKEMGLCEVVCANCHRLRTGQRRRAAAGRVADGRRATRRRNVLFVREMLKRSVCVDCGLDDHRLLEFDHVDGKSANVGFLTWRECSLETIAAEIAKCVVRCVNCHRRRTAELGRHYRYVALRPL